METNDNQSGNDLSQFSAQITSAVEGVGESIVAVDARPRVATSGVIWRAGGVIVSTDHTVRRNDNINVTLADGRATSATLVGRDAGTDLAVLKVDDQEVAKSLKSADTGDTSQVKVGNIILAVGRSSVDRGIAAGFGIVNSVGGAWRTWRGDKIERLISLDVGIFLGFSGGALVSPEGKVLGINTSAFGRGLALTIPSETVNRVVDAILAGGKTARPYLGIGTQPVSLPESLRERLNIEQRGGLMMLTVEPDGPADKAGGLIGDILLSLGDKPTLDPSDVQAALWEQTAGNTVRARILRGGELREIEITLGEHPTREAESGAPKSRRRGGCR